MKNLNEIVNELSAPNAGGKGQSVYFIGIGGIGMSALARYFNAKGIAVSGYDKTATALCKQLETEGIKVHYEDNLDLIDKAAALVVYTPAIPKDQKGLNFYQQNNYLLVKRSEVLGAITNTSFNICVAGTHGKTTTSSMVAHILRDSGYGCNAFLGGIAANYNSNFWPQDYSAAGSSNKNVCVVEADEYDRSFLKLIPDVAIITSMDPDHLDIYGTAENVEQAFLDFSSKIKNGGCLILKHGLKRREEFKVNDTCTYAANHDDANIHTSNIKIENGAYRFDVRNNFWAIENIVLNMGGLHNIENIVAAIGVAKYLGIANEKIKAAVNTYKGVKRRFEYIIPPNATGKKDVVQIDDYAHHPDELKALLAGAKDLFPERKCTIIFQPHLYSRTRDFADGFATVLDMADEIILLPIYPARELPMEGVNSEMILSRMKNKQAIVLSKEALMERIEREEMELLITAGAGDIDTLVQPVKKILVNKNLKKAY